MKDWSEIIADLIATASTKLPEDIREALTNAAIIETNQGAKAILNTILTNVSMAESKGIPMCQDTGTLSFLIKAPYGTNTLEIEEGIFAGIEKATARGLLRLNTIAVPSGAQVSENHAPGNPAIHFEFEKRNNISVQLIMKGGGSENMSCQYSLPDSRLNAGRDLDGVRKCVLDAVHNAQGNGCAPGILGVCIGGDREGGFAHAKLQLRRKLTDKAELPELADLEERLLKEANSLGIGPMGLGGKTTILGVKIGSIARLPASFFVTIAYCCWACRRAEAIIEC
jgi:fumarate hydratase class I